MVKLIERSASIRVLKGTNVVGIKRRDRESSWRISEKTLILRDVAQMVAGLPKRNWVVPDIQPPLVQRNIRSAVDNKKERLFEEVRQIHSMSNLFCSACTSGATSWTIPGTILLQSFGVWEFFHWYPFFSCRDRHARVNVCLVPRCKLYDGWEIWNLCRL